MQCNMYIFMFLQMSRSFFSPFNSFVLSTRIALINFFFFFLVFCLPHLQWNTNSLKTQIETVSLIARASVPSQPLESCTHKKATLCDPSRIPQSKLNIVSSVLFSHSPSFPSLPTLSLWFPPQETSQSQHGIHHCNQRSDIKILSSNRENK